MNTFTHPMRVNLHTHTTRCGHATGDEREYIEHAIKSGLTTLGFSDHAPYVFTGDHYSGFRMRPNRQEDYFETLLKLREEYKDRIDIRIGYEAEYYPEFFSAFSDLISPYPVDYLILGQHFIENEISGIYSGFEHSEEEYLACYADQVIEAIDTELFSYVAHPDLFNFTGSRKVYEKHYSRLIEHAKKTGTPLEINILGLGGRHYPSDKFFSLVGEIGAEVVIGSDAHSPESVYLDHMYKRALEMCERHRLKLNTSPKLRKVK